MRIAESRLRSLIRESLKRILAESIDASVLYTGVVLDDEEVIFLRDMIEALGLENELVGWETSNIGLHGNEQLNHHMTVAVGALKPDNQLRELFGEPFELRIVGWGLDNDLGVAAWQVEPLAAIPVKSGNPHITAALRDAKSKPFHAGKIKEWIPLDRPFTIVGKLKEVRPAVKDVSID